MSQIKNNLKLISLHIPKTAGTSFRNILKQVYGADHVVRFDVKERYRKMQIEQEDFSGDRLPDHIQVVHGHFFYRDANKFFDIQNVPLITWLRDPVERIISNYYYFEDRLSDLLKKEPRGEIVRRRMQKSLLEFAAMPNNQNRTSKFLRGADLKQFTFIGLTEFMSEDLKDLATILNWPRYKELVQNKTSIKKPKVGNETRELIRSWNDKDAALYDEILDIRAKRREKLKRAAL